MFHEQNLIQFMSEITSLFHVLPHYLFAHVTETCSMLHEGIHDNLPVPYCFPKSLSGFVSHMQL